MYKTKALFHPEPLPFDTYIPENADKLILGTFPTKESLRKFKFFYPNTSNKFWRILAGLQGKELEFLKGDEAVDERRKILDKLNLAISDMGHTIYRQNESSLDANIFPVEFTNVFQIIDDNPQIKTIIITSSTKGTSVLSWFLAYCQLNDVTVYIPKKPLIPWETLIHFNNKTVKIIVIYSTSGATYIEEPKLVAMYRLAILFNKTSEKI
ncbi:MAG: mismatch-specific glycosylase [Mucilaginibacter sp.]|nr:mismatch-specific glycosylase [Mucilaginibacter sp.]